MHRRKRRNTEDTEGTRRTRRKKKNTENTEIDGEGREICWVRWLEYGDGWRMGE
jgi:hypothetical protein